MREKRSLRPGLAKMAVICCTLVAVTAVVVWYLAWPDQADRTIAMQRALLARRAGPDEVRQEIEAIMKSVDLLKADDVRRVRDSLFSDLAVQRRQSMDRYFAASETEKPAVLDDDIARVRLVSSLFDAINPGGIRLRTEQEQRQSEDRRKSREEGNARRSEERSEDRGREAAPPGSRQKAEEYMTALRQRAEDQGVDLGRFGGRRRRG